MDISNWYFDRREEDMERFVEHKTKFERLDIESLNPKFCYLLDNSDIHMITVQRDIIMYSINSYQNGRWIESVIETPEPVFKSLDNQFKSHKFTHTSISDVEQYLQAFFEKRTIQKMIKYKQLTTVGNSIAIKLNNLNFEILGVTKNDEDILVFKSNFNGIDLYFLINEKTKMVMTFYFNGTATIPYPMPDAYKIKFESVIGRLAWST